MKVSKLTRFEIEVNGDHCVVGEVVEREGINVVVLQLSDGGGDTCAVLLPIVIVAGVVEDLVRRICDAGLVDPFVARAFAVALREAAAIIDTQAVPRSSLIDAEPNDVRSIRHYTCDGCGSHVVVLEANGVVRCRECQGLAISEEVPE